MFSKICAHSERYSNLSAGIFEILTFDGNIAFPLSPVSQLKFFLCYNVISYAMPGTSHAVGAATCARVRYDHHPAEQHTVVGTIPLIPLITLITLIPTAWSVSSSVPTDV